MYHLTAVRESMTGEWTVSVNAIGTDHDDRNRASETLGSPGLTVVDQKLIRDEYVCPYHDFLDAHEEPEGAKAGRTEPIS